MNEKSRLAILPICSFFVWKGFVTVNVFPQVKLFTGLTAFFLCSLSLLSKINCNFYTQIKISIYFGQQWNQIGYVQFNIAVKKGTK